MIGNPISNSKKRTPFFSVVITTYNRSALLARALNSLIQQTEKDWEAIIIDDGSTDDTPGRIGSFLKSGKEINYIRQPSRGATDAKNAGIRLCKGKYITFLDSDDEYQPSHLESRKKILQDNPQVKFLYGGIKVIGSQYVPDRFNYGKMVHLDDCSIGGTFFIKSEVFFLLNGFADIPLGSDADFFGRINKAGISGMKAQAPTYIYHRENANSITNNLAACSPASPAPKVKNYPRH